MSDMMLKVDNINVYYGQIHTLKDVSIEVKKGEIVVSNGGFSLLGESIKRMTRTRSGKWWLWKNR